MMHYDMPKIHGDVEEQLRQIRSCMYQMTERMNYNLDLTTPQHFWQEAVRAVEHSDNEQETAVQRDNYAALKSLIIKSATETLKDEDTFNFMLEGKFLAKSDFGVYLENTKVDVHGDSMGFTQLYDFAAGIQTKFEGDLSGLQTNFEGNISDLDDKLTGKFDGLSGDLSNLSGDFYDFKVRSENYIKEGYLDTSGSKQIFGIEVGVIKSTFSYKDNKGIEHTITNSAQKKIRITPDKLSFFDGTREVAYMENNAIYFPNAYITGGELNIGQGTFTVDNHGNMTATRGYVGGWAILTNRLECDRTSVDGGYRSGMQCNPLGGAAFFAGCRTPSGEDIASPDITKFYVTQSGKLYAQQAEIEGKITAKSGKIAGFEIADESTNPSNGFWKNSLSTVTNEGTTYNATFIRAAGHGNVAIGIKTITKKSKPTQDDWINSSDYLFYVSHNGSFYAKKATIEGSVTATSGTIGGWTILEKRIENDNVGIGGYRSGMQANSSGAAFFAGCRTPAGGSIADPSASNFYVTQTGKLYAQEVDIKGTINAIDGSIAGWNITGSRIEKDNTKNGGYRVGIQNQVEGAAFYAGCSTADGGNIADKKVTKFYVTQSGKLFAQQADIEGTITASSGTIGGWTIGSDKLESTKSGYNVALCNFDNANDDSRVLYCQKKSNEDYTFRLLRNGELLATNANITGTITANSGSIAGWKLINNRIENDNVGSGGYRSGMQYNTSGAAFYAGCSTSAGGTIASKDTTQFYVTQAGKLIAQSVDISGNIVATSGTMKNMAIIGAIDIGNSEMNNYTSNGIGIRGYFNTAKSGLHNHIVFRVLKEQKFGSGSINEHLAVGAGAYDMGFYAQSSFFNHNVGIYGDLLVTGRIVGQLYDGSDRRLKNSIDNLPQKIETMFEKLRPTTFKMNSDAEGITRYGFIAQEVEQSMIEAGIDVNNNAIISKDTKSDEEYMILCYTQFIPINTYMIQRCLEKIAALKQEIEELKAERA